MRQPDFWNLASLSQTIPIMIRSKLPRKMPLTFSLAAGTSAYLAQVVQVIIIRPFRKQCRRISFVREADPDGPIGRRKHEDDRLLF